MTAHIESNKEDIAEVVLMPGDPLRAKYIAENFLENYKIVNKVRNMFFYTGYYKNKKVTIASSGMGIPSIGIYAYELYKYYNVQNIIRIGTAGSYIKDLNLFDIVLVDNSYSESTYALTQNGYSNNLIKSSTYLNSLILKTAEQLNQYIKLGNIHSSEVFYKENNNYQDIYEKYNCLGVEMESFALFHNANVLNKKAACLLTISDSLVTKKQTTSEQRQNSLNKMIEIALESVIKM